jgi:hypothetical protein
MNKIAKIKTIERSVEFVFENRELRYEYTFKRGNVCEIKLIDINLCKDLLGVATDLSERTFANRAMLQLKNQLIIPK